jgi:hypothetical protein
MVVDTKSSEPFYQLTGLQAYQMYQIRIAAYDLAGNVSALSGMKTVRTGDFTSPTVPSNVTMNSRDGMFYLLSWEPSLDNGFVKGYQIFVNGKQYGTKSVASTTNPGERVTFLMASLPHGTHKVQVRAYDGTGNKSPLSAVVWSPKLLRIEKNKLYINGVLTDLGRAAQPITSNGTMLIPGKPLLEGLGLTTQWFQGSKLMLAKSANKNTIIQFAADSMNVEVTMNGTKSIKKLNTLPVIVDGNLYIPVKFVADQFGYQFSIRN